MTGEYGSLARSLDDAVQRGQPSQLSIAGSGTVSVYPREACYVTDIHDWDAVYACSAGQILVRPLAWSVAPVAARPLGELRWRAAFHHHCRGGLDEPPALGHGLVHLKSWPDLPCLPEELLAPVARICALLWRKPTVAYLIPRILQLPPSQVLALLRVLDGFGHVDASGLGFALPGHGGAEAEGQPAAANEPAAEGGSFIAKLWQRLAALQAA